MSFANRLKQLRKQYNLTQEELAQKISKTRSTIAGYETERKEPDYEVSAVLLDTLKILCAANTVKCQFSIYTIYSSALNYKQCVSKMLAFKK